MTDYEKKLESPLRVSLEDSELVIRIGINRIDGNDYHPTIPVLKFDNRLEWVEDVIRAMTKESEDGSSMLTNLFDNAMSDALEFGSCGIAEDSPTHIGQCDSCLEDCVPLRWTRHGNLCPKCKVIIRGNKNEM